VRCLYHRGGRWCGRAARKRVGVYVDGHEPGEWHLRCEEHARLMAETAFDDNEHERMVRVLTLDLEEGT